MACPEKQATGESSCSSFLKKTCTFLVLQLRYLWWFSCMYVLFDVWLTYRRCCGCTHHHHHRRRVSGDTTSSRGSEYLLTEGVTDAYSSYPPHTPEVPKIQWWPAFFHLFSFKGPRLWSGNDLKYTDINSRIFILTNCHLGCKF